MNITEALARVIELQIRITRLVQQEFPADHPDRDMCERHIAELVALRESLNGDMMLSPLPPPITGQFPSGIRGA